MADASYTAMDKAVSRVARQGVVAFAAAGNEGRDACNFTPGRNGDAIIQGRADHEAKLEIGEAKANASLGYDEHRSACDCRSSRPLCDSRSARSAAALPVLALLEINNQSVIGPRGLNPPLYRALYYHGENSLSTTVTERYGTAGAGVSDGEYGT